MGDKMATLLRNKVITETAFVLWKLRNVNRIQDETITLDRVVSTWQDALLRLARSDYDIARLTDGRT